MKTLILLIALAISISACKQHSIKIRDNAGNDYTAKVAPCMEQSLPDTGKVITIMKPSGALSMGMGYVYNSDCWKKADTTAMWGTISREIVTGKVIAVTEN